MLTSEDRFVLEEVKAMGYAIGALHERASGRWAIAAISPAGMTVKGDGATRSEAIWALRDAVMQVEPTVGA